VDLFQLGQGGGRIRLGWGNKLQQRFGIVGGDLRVGQRRAQGSWMRGQGQLAFAIDAQAFTLDPVQALGQQGEVGVLAKLGQAAGEQVALDCIPSRIGCPNMGTPDALYKGARKPLAAVDSAL
jgi:hypothetical protein